MADDQGAYTPGARFFQNRACPYFPCHEGVSEQAFNCLFCYCPLYALGPYCGGSFCYTEQGVKNCINCTLLHDGDGGSDIVQQRFAMLAELARDTRDDMDGDRA